MHVKDCIHWEFLQHCSGLRGHKIPLQLCENSAQETSDGLPNFCKHCVPSGQHFPPQHPCKASQHSTLDEFPRLFPRVELHTVSAGFPVLHEQVMLLVHFPFIQHFVELFNGQHVLPQHP